MKMCSMDSLLAKIDLAGTTKELEAIAEKYYICDVSDFSKITVNGVKKTLKILVKVLYQFPKLRSRFCYVGTHSTYAADIQSLINGDTEIMKDFGLHYICDSKIARDLGGLIYAMARDTLNSPETYVATAVNACGFFDAILLDQNDYEGFAYMSLIRDIKYNEQTGFHPKGCDSPESIIYHEIGHMMDDLCGLSAGDRNFAMLYNSLSYSQIRECLSQYATTSPQEFIAEAFAEYMCSPYPRQLARDVYNLIIYKYQMLK